VGGVIRPPRPTNAPVGSKREVQEMLQTEVGEHVSEELPSDAVFEPENTLKPLGKVHSESITNGRL